MELCRALETHLVASVGHALRSFYRVTSLNFFLDNVYTKLVHSNVRAAVRRGL